jgi:hypothetical protein
LLELNYHLLTGGDLACFALAVMQPHNFLLQKLVGARSGPLSFNKCSVASVDKLAEQNGHKAELQALRQEANRGDEERGYRI